MKKKIIVLILSLIILTEIVCIAGLCACKGRDQNKTDVTIRDMPQQTVLYTIYRGDSYQVGYAISKLYALAHEKGISPLGPVSTCRLNSPLLEEDDHGLIEIQIPVEENAIKQAGTLGDMTDVKVLPAMRVAVAVKPEGDGDPTEVIANLFSWINEKGFVVKGRMRQIVLGGSKGSYHNLRTEFIIPIEELPEKNRLTLTMDPCYM
jgi:effector-binding domain-containing protein